MLENGKANDVKYSHEPSLSDAVTDKEEETHTRSIAAEKFHVGERKIREATF